MLSLVLNVMMNLLILILLVISVARYVYYRIAEFVVIVMSFLFLNFMRLRAAVEHCLKSHLSLSPFDADLNSKIQKKKQIN